MDSKYDNIQTAAELVAEVMAHGMSIAQDDINRAADIFGNTGIRELDRLANDIGRNNDKGEPDPEGSWSSDRPATQDAFYAIAFNVWSWEQATRFYNKHTNPVTKRAKETEQKLAEEIKLKDCAFADRAHLREELRATHGMYTEEYNKRIATENVLNDAQQEILTLKAKLYDLMIAGA